MISMAMDLAAQQLRDGTASSQVITHYLKLGSMRERLERERLVAENQLLKAKAKAIDEQKEYAATVERAIKAMRTYQGLGDPDDY